MGSRLFVCQTSLHKSNINIIFKMWTSLKDSYTRSIVKREPVVHPKAPLAVVEKLQKAAVKANLDQELRDMFGTYVKRSLLKEAPDLTSTVTADICDDCGVQMMVIANDSMLACSRCAKTRVITSANAWTAAMDVDFSTISNHQKSRLLEWLEFAQAKEYGEIPPHILQDVMTTLHCGKITGLECHAAVISKERLSGGPFTDSTNAIERLKPLIPDIEMLLRSLDGIIIRNVVRSTTSKKFGERGAKIASLLSGYFPERMTADQEEYVRKLFMAASPVYDRWRKTCQPVWPGGYAYFLRCLMILLGWDEFAAMFPIQITGRNQEREDMRRDIWAILKWDNVPSSGPQSLISLADGSPDLDGATIAHADKRCKITARGYDEL
jgi:Poxvirus Late Transcription Factor VLTF3 like